MTNALVKNLSWTFFSRIGTQLAQILFTVFLARMLTPAEYGIIGMLAVFSGFALLIGEAGLTSALIYFDKLENSHWSTAFWIQIFINAAFTITFFFGAPLIAHFFENPVIEPVTKIMSLTFILQTVGQIQNTILVKRMDFKSIAIANFVACVVSNLCAVALAVNHFGVYSLVWQSLVNGIVLSIYFAIVTRWFPNFVFSMREARHLMSYGNYLAGNNVVNYWLRNGDNLVIGKFLGAAELGIYNRAYTLMLLPLQNISSTIGQVMFPTLVQLKDDIVAFRELYCKSIKYIALIGFPIMGGLCILSKPILLLLYGQQWVASAPLLQILSLVGLMQCVIFPVGWIYNGVGKPKDQFRITLYLTPLFFILILGGIYWGIIGVTIGYAIWATVSAVWNILAAGKLIDLTIDKYLGLIVKKAMSTLVMMFVVGLLVAFMIDHLVLPVVVFLSVAVGAITYALSCLILKDQEFGTGLSVARDRIWAMFRSSTENDTV
ncbi:lipopolysaccharide biosynthesis protein [Asticcacaulis sp.]|uniref:lipopolysaccharide biosynthesis protein n=1 Tax=Asticcacaulis sp. TaxID=1872648 RepID=UPI0031D517D2